MDYSSVLQQVQAALGPNNEWKFELNQLPEEMAKMIRETFLLEDELKLELNEIVENEPLITVSGISGEGVIKGMDVKIVFDCSSAVLKLSISAEKDKGWFITGAFSSISNTALQSYAFDNVSVHWRSDSAENKLDFDGEIALENELGTLGQFIQLPRFELNGAINVSKGVPLLKFEFAHTGVFPNTFLDNLPLKIGIVCEEMDSDLSETKIPIAYLFIRTVFSFETEEKTIHLPLQANIVDPKHNVSFRAEVNELSQIGIDALETLFHSGEADLSGVLDGQVSLAETFGLDYLQFTLDPTGDDLLTGVEMVASIHHPITLLELPHGNHLDLETLKLCMRMDYPLNGNKRKWGLSARSDISFLEDVKLFMSLQVPQAEFRASLNTQKVALNKLIQRLSGETVEGLDLEVDRLSIQANPKTGNYGFVAELIGHHSINKDQNDWHIEHISFSAKKDEEKLALSFNGFFKWFQLNFDLSGHWETGTGGGLSFFGEVTNTNSVDLLYLMETVGHSMNIEVPHFEATLELKKLAVGINTQTKAFHFEAETVFSVDHLGVLDVSLTSDTRVMIDASKKDGQTQIVAELSSKLDIGGQHFDLRTHIGKDHQLVYANWEAENEGLRLSKLMQAFDKEHSNEEYGVDLDLMLKSIAIEYDHSGSEHKLVARAITEIDIAGTAHDLQVFIIAWKNNGWEFLFGIEYDDKAAHLGHLKGPNKEAFSSVDLIKLKKAALVFATGNFEKFTLPDLPKFKDEDTAPNLLLLNHELKIQKGVYAIAEVEFNGSSQGIDKFKELSKHTGDLIIQAGYNAALESVTIDVLLDGEIIIPGETRKDDFTLSDARFHIELPGLSFFLSGKARFNIDHHRIVAQGGIGISTEEVIGEFKVNLSDPENPDNVSFFGLNDLFLDDILFVLGVNFTHGSIEFGGEIGLHQEGAPIDSDKMGLILEIIDGIPNPQFFELQIDEIDFGRIMELFSGTDSDGHAKHHEVIKARIEDLYLYWAQKKVRLMDREILPGFAFRGEFDFFNIQAYLNVKVGEEYGIMGEIHVSPIHIENIVTVVGDGEAVVIQKYKDDKGKWHKIPEATLRELPDGTETDNFTIVEAGGPVVILNSNESPYLHADVQVRLLDLITLNVSANINDDSFDFDFLLNAGNILVVELHCDMNDKKSFRAFGGFHLGVDFDLSVEFLGESIGVHIDFGMDIEVALGFINEDKKKPDDLDRGAYLYFSFKGNFLGIHIGPFEMALTLNVDELEKIPGKALESLKNELFSSVQDVLDFIFDHDKYVRDKRREAAEQQRSGSRSNHQKYIDDVRKEWDDNRKKDLDQHHSKSKESNISKILNDLSKKRTAMYHGSRTMAGRIDAIVGDYTLTVTGEVQEILELTKGYKEHFGKHAEFVQEDRFTNEEAIQMSKWNTQAEKWRKDEHVSEVHKKTDDQIAAIRSHVKNASEAAVTRATGHFGLQK